MADIIKCVEATASLDLGCDCPYCGEYVDLMPMDTENDSVLQRTMFSSEWDDLDVVFDCPECGQTFTVEKIVY